MFIYKKITINLFFEIIYIFGIYLFLVTKNSMDIYSNNSKLTFCSFFRIGNSVTLQQMVEIPFANKVVDR